MGMPLRQEDGSGDRVEDHRPGRLRRVVASARADDLVLYSAALAFYGLVSVAPLIVLALCSRPSLLATTRSTGWQPSWTGWPPGRWVPTKLCSASPKSGPEPGWWP